MNRDTLTSPTAHSYEHLLGVPSPRKSDQSADDYQRHRESSYPEFPTDQSKCAAPSVATSNPPGLTDSLALADGTHPGERGKAKPSQSGRPEGMWPSWRGQCIGTPASRAETRGRRPSPCGAPAPPCGSSPSCAHRTASRSVAGLSESHQVPPQPDKLELCILMCQRTTLTRLSLLCFP